MSGGATPQQREVPAVQGHVAKGLMIGFALQLLVVPFSSSRHRNAPAVGQAPLADWFTPGPPASPPTSCPAVLYFRKKGQHQVVKGLWIAASIVAVLSASCWRSPKGLRYI